MSAAARHDAHDGPDAPKPPPWTAEQLRQICGFVTAGLPLTLACDAAGVRWTTARHWHAKGRRGVAPYDVFFGEVRKAKAMHAAACRVAISKHMATDWRAAAWSWEKLEAAEHRARIAREAAGQIAGQEPGEATVIMYPVPVPEGADLATLPRLPTPADEHAIDTVGTSDGTEETDDDDDDEWIDD